MTAYHKPCQQFIRHGVHIILDDAKHVEPTQNWLGKLNILRKWYRRIILPADGVSCGNDGTACLEGSDDTGLGDRNCLLLHRLVDRRPVPVVHLVELVDEAHAFIRQYECATLERPFTCHGVFTHARCKTDSRRTLPSSEHSSVGRLLHILQKLTLRRAWITEQKDVDITPDSVFSPNVLRHASKERESNRRLDVFVPINRRCDALDDSLRNAFVLGQLSDLPLIFLVEAKRREEVFFFVYVVCFEDR